MNRILTFTSRSKLLLGGLIALAVAITLFVWFEVSQSREELLRFVDNEARMLIETVNRSSATTVEANAELERGIIERLRISARLVERDLRGGNTPALAQLAGDLSVDLIVVVDDRGRVALSSHTQTIVPDTTRPDSSVYTELLDPVLRGEYSWLAQGNMRTPWSNERMYLFVQERADRRGAVLLGIASSAMLDMRLRLGIGKLLRDIGTGPSIEYVVLQDEEGILTASDGVREMSAIRSDGFLRAAFGTDSARSRIIAYAGTPVFEIVKHLHLGEQGAALMRIGLSLEYVRSIQQRSMHRAIFIAIGFFITASIFLVLLFTRQRYGILQQEHRKVRSYTDLVLDNIADAVVATDAQGTVTVFNQSAARLLGPPDAAVIGRPCREICSGDALRLHHTRETALPIPYEETPLSLPNGEQRILAVSTSVIRDGGGAVETIIAIARDITEQRRVQEQLQRKDRMTAMGELAGGIAHEIRNPLNAINIIAQRFQREFTPVKDVDEYLQLTQTVRSEVQRVNGIITQFLDFARPTRLALERCDVASLLRGSLEVVGSQAAQRNVRLQLLTDDGLFIMADREKMQQVMLNILQNGIEALADGGVIKIVACSQGAHIAITIADNGPGISEDIRRKIFNLYFTTKATGTGLGLSIVHQIISEHDGEITVTSIEDGGTSFQILLPTAAADPAGIREAMTPS